MGIKGRKVSGIGVGRALQGHRAPVQLFTSREIETQSRLSGFPKVTHTASFLQKKRNEACEKSRAVCPRNYDFFFSCLLVSSGSGGRREDKRDLHSHSDSAKWQLRDLTAISELQFSHW